MGMTKLEYKNLLAKEISINNIFKIKNIPSLYAVYLIRKSQYNYHKGKIGKIISKIYVNKLVKLYGIFIHPEVKIGAGLKLPHPNGIIIGKSVSIGKNCTIYQQVTIGSSNIGDYKIGKQPNIKNDVILFAGSKIIGDINIESGTIIGANAVVTKNSSENGIYAGIPAKLLKMKE